MKTLICILLTAIIFIVPAGPAFAWGDDGHQTVGKIASLRIKPRTAEKIVEIFKAGRNTRQHRHLGRHGKGTHWQ